MDVAIAATGGRSGPMNLVLFVADGLGGVPLRAIGHPSESSECPPPYGPSDPVALASTVIGAGLPGSATTRTAVLTMDPVRAVTGIGRCPTADGRREVRRRSSHSSSATAPASGRAIARPHHRRVRTRRQPDHRHGHRRSPQEGTSR